MTDTQVANVNIRHIHENSTEFSLYIVKGSSNKSWLGKFKTPFGTSRLYTMRHSVAIQRVYNYSHKSLPWIIVCQISYPLWQRALLKFQLCGRDNPVREESRFHFLVAFMFFRVQLKSKTLHFRKCQKNYLCDVVKMPEHAELLWLQPSFKMSPDNGNVVYNELEAT